MQSCRERLQQIVIDTKSLGGQPLKRHMPATVGRETAGARRRHRGAVVGPPHITKRQHTIVPIDMTAKLLDAVGKPGRLDLHRFSMRVGLQFYRRGASPHLMPHLCREIDRPAGREVVPDPLHTTWHGISQFVLEHDL